MSIRVEARGSHRAGRVLAEITRSLGFRVQAGVMAAGGILFEASQEMVPRDTHALALSGVLRREGEGLDTVAVVGYGRFGDVLVEHSSKEGRVVLRRPEEYAVIVHERYDRDGAGYLENPTLTKQPEMRQAMNAALRGR